MNKLASSLAKSMSTNGVNPNGDGNTGRFTNAATRPNLTIDTRGESNNGGATSADAIPIDTRNVGSASMIGLKSEFESDEPNSPTTPNKKRVTLFSNANHHLNSSPHPNVTINTSNFAATGPGGRPISTGQYGQSSGGSSHPRPFNFAGNSATLSRRSLAMRALAFRLLGYILIPTICILPGVIQDLFGKVDPVAGSRVPDAVTTLLDTLNGLVGLFNAILYAYDPALLALYQIMKNERREKRYFDAKEGDASPPRQNPNNQGDVEMGQVNTVYVTPPESPVEGEAPGFLGILRGNHKRARSNTSRSGRSNQRLNGEPESGPGSGTTTPGGRRVEKTELENGTKVEVRTGKFLTPILIGSKTRKAERALPTPRNFIDMSSQHSLGLSGYASADDGGMSDTGNPMAARRYYGPPSPGIMVQVDVQIRDDQDRDLERLERYLGGL
ncbi:11636_t:CDS:1 [Acaulospora colombiana]|uniref:11636_t:CDS:1 n=1 Tax=Acaulospora colombiana TaxID=27376 RepID=A0ACA9NI42_9GLOM|nr:11636_t:CDS:1 [Acaulospora colombiana]